MVVFNGQITLAEADKKQSSLLNTIFGFNSRARLIANVYKKKKKKTYKSINALHEGLENFDLMLFVSRIFLLKFHLGIEILTPRQMLQRLPIALAQIKAGNSSGILLNQIMQFVYSFHQAEEIIKEVDKNITDRHIINIMH